MSNLTVSAFMFLICMVALLSTAEGSYLRCQCIEVHSKPPIPVQKILSLKVIPAGPQCKDEEIIATMKRGQMCLNPEEDWVISLKEKMSKRRS